MGSGIALDDALIISVVLEGILYGFSLLMFIGTMCVLTQKRSGYLSHWTITTSVAVVLLVLSTAHMVVSIVRMDEGLVKYRNTFPGGPVAFFADISQWSYLARNSIYTLQTLIGDGVVIHRCYIVWQSVWIVAVPCLLWCSVAVTGVVSVYNASQGAMHATDVFSNRASQWITTFFVSTFLANLISSGLLAYRIWSIERNVSFVRTSKSTLRPLLYALIHAGVLYSAILFVTIVCFVTANNGEYIVVEFIMPVISIAFYMVLIRIAMQRNSNARYTRTMTSGLATRDTACRLRPLQVRISHFSGRDAFPQFWLVGEDILSEGKFDGVGDEA